MSLVAEELVHGGQDQAPRLSGTDGAQSGDARVESLLWDAQPLRTRSRSSFELMMQLTQDEEQVLAMPRIRVFGQAPQDFRSLLLIEMDVDKGEAHGEHEEWRCEQKGAVAPHKCVIDAGTLERSVAKQRIGDWNQNDRSKNDARC